MPARGVEVVEGVHLAGQRGEGRGRLFIHVLLLGRVFRKVVQFALVRTHVVHEFPVVRAHGVDIVPAGVGEGARFGAPLEQCEQALAVGRGIRHGHAEHVEHGGVEVGGLHGGLKTRAGKPAPGKLDHQRYLAAVFVGLFVHEHAVLTEGLAVVRRENDERVVIKLFILQKGEELREFRIDHAQAVVIQRRDKGPFLVADRNLLLVRRHEELAGRQRAKFGPGECGGRVEGFREHAVRRHARLVGQREALGV